ncbi:MAG TPA: cell division protein FtsH, partial [Candidatus Parcubacteria bacterium]|nr:cell division protein FtsH [Candidatus Parcubacteria bacterium]
MKNRSPIKSLTKNFLIILLIFLIISGIFTLVYQPFEEIKEIPLSQLVQDINQEKVKGILISGNNISITYTDETEAKSKKEIESALSQSLINYGVDNEKLNLIEIKSEEAGGIMVWLLPISMLLFPILIIGLFLWMILRQAKSGAMQAFDFSKAKARLFGAEGHSKERITFKNVAGLKETKEELKE